MDIDEGGVTRLQNILTQDKELADDLAASFEAAAAAVRDFVKEVSENLPTLFSGEGHGVTTENLSGAGLAIGLDFGQAQEDLDAFIQQAKKPITLSANFSSAVSAARTAMSTIRSIFSSPITIQAKVEVSGDDSNPDLPVIDKPGQTGDGSLLLSSGGRFTEHTKAEIAEDGGTEYVIPVNREDRAIPLIRQLLQELTPAARDSILGSRSLSGEKQPGMSTQSGAAGENPSAPESIPAGRASLRDAAPDPLPDSVFSRLAETLTVPQPASSVVNQNTQNVSAPVSINVNASGVSAEAIGETVYDTAERYLLRTLKGANL